MVTRGVVVRVVVLALFLALAPTAHADPCDPAEVTELHDHLASQSAKANTWNTAWRWIFTGAAVGTAVTGAIDPFPSWEIKYGLYGSAGKATIGALARWFMPLRIRPPAITGDACTDLAAMRKEVTRVARKQRSLFWMGHIGGILVNLGGALYVYYYDGTGKALLSIAIGYPVGVTSNYTMPRGTLKLYRSREAAWTVTNVGAMPLRDARGGSGWMLGIGGEF